MLSVDQSSPSYEQLVRRWKLYKLNVPKKGRGVFAGTSIPPQQLILKFEGPVFDRDTCPNFEESIQVSIATHTLSGAVKVIQGHCAMVGRHDS
jgi:hypothetical protein